MDITLSTLEAEALPESSMGFVKTTKPLLKSNYKNVAEQNLSSIKLTSLFAKRQHLKFKRFNSIVTAGVILKMTLFVFVLSMIL